MSVKLIDQPFKYYLQENFFSKKQFRALFDFAQGTAWAYYDDESFPQYIIQRDLVKHFFLDNKQTKSIFSFLFNTAFISGLEPLFNLSLTKCVAISFHKLVSSNFNIVHNDFNTSGEQLRIVCYLTGPEAYEGGCLNLYQITDLNSPHTCHKLNANTAFIFEMNQSSFHSVSEVTSGERICIVITYQ